MERNLRKPGRRDGAIRPLASLCHRPPDRRFELPPTPPRRPPAREYLLRACHRLVRLGQTQTARSPIYKRRCQPTTSQHLKNRKSEEYYFATSGEYYTDIDKSSKAACDCRGIERIGPLSTLGTGLASCRSARAKLRTRAGFRRQAASASRSSRIVNFRSYRPTPRSQSAPCSAR